MINILVLDDNRTFENTATQRFHHIRTNDGAVIEMAQREFDEVWLDYDLGATDKKKPTSMPTAAWMTTNLQRGTQVRIITDQPHYAKALAERLDGLRPAAIITLIGLRWSAEHDNLALDERDEADFLKAAGVGRSASR